MNGLPALTDEQIHRYDIPGPRYTSYPTAPEWTTDFGPAELRERLEAAGRADPTEPLSTYIHIPFCKELCTYCGCNIVIAKSPDRADAYVERLEKEMALVAPLLRERRGLSQIHWGGGTPTFLSEAQLSRLWAAIRAHFAPLPDAEIAIEVDPAITTHEQLDLLRSLGFNRLSMGVQDFDPEVHLGDPIFVRGVSRVELDPGASGGKMAGRLSGKGLHRVECSDE